MKSSWHALLLGLLIMTMTSCLQEQPSLPNPEDAGNVDMGLITGEPCAPPCWQGISPGNTRGLTLTTLEKLEVIDTATIEEQPDGTVSWDGGVITFNDQDLVTSIFVILPYRLELQELIAIQGEPEGYSFDRHPEQTVGNIGLYWPRQGLWAQVRNVNVQDVNEGIAVQPNSLIYGVNYIESLPDAESYYLELVGPSDDPAVTSAEYHGFIEWEGFLP